MSYKNPKDLLTAATALPAAIEAKLPEGAPKLSTMLLDATGKMPDLPDFLIELPDLPPVPELPALPELPGAPAGLGRRYVTGVEVREAIAPAPAPMRIPNASLWPGPTPLVQAYTQPIEGVVGTVQVRRGM